MTGDCWKRGNNRTSDREVVRHIVVILEDTARFHFQTESDTGLCYEWCVVTYYTLISVGFAEHMLRKHCEPGMVRKPNPEDILHHFLSHREESGLQWAIIFLALQFANLCLSVFTTVCYLRGRVEWTVKVLNLYPLEQKRHLGCSLSQPPGCFLAKIVLRGSSWSVSSSCGVVWSFCMLVSCKPVFTEFLASGFRQATSDGNFWILFF